MTDQSTAFPRLFSPQTIGRKTVLNRIVSTPHSTAKDVNGVITENLIRYHVRKAQGGTGLIMTFGSASVDPSATAAYGHIDLWKEENIDPLTDMAERVHAYDALLISQATHMGHRSASRGQSRAVIKSPSGIPDEVHREIPAVLKKSEIREIIAAFARTAQRLESCGWDGIEVTSFGGHLIEQFWSPLVNQRHDEYGGSFENRSRFAIEALDAVKNAVSDDFIVSFRLTGNPMSAAIGLSPDDMLDIAARLDNTGLIDLFNISGGTGGMARAQNAVVPYENHPVGCFNPLARAMRERLSKPVIGAGRILDPVQAEAALAAGDFDLASMERAIIADPDLANRARRGETARIRPCTAINEGCIGRLYAGFPIACSVNPAIEDDTLEHFPAVNQVRRVTVVGGGPAGMEAARVATERGHHVTLYEACACLGGQIRTTARVPDRPNYARHVDWLERELDRLGVTVHLSRRATEDMLLADRPEAIVLATGATAVCPPTLCGDDARCITDIDLLQDHTRSLENKRVLVYDVQGQRRGADAANAAADRGAAYVELASHLFEVCVDVDLMEKPAVYGRLGKNQVVITARKRLARNDAAALLLRDEWDGTERDLGDFDLLVIVGFEVADTSMAVLHDQVETVVYEIGDRRAPRYLRNAVAEGVDTGRAL